MTTSVCWPINKSSAFRSFSTYKFETHLTYSNVMSKLFHLFKIFLVLRTLMMITLIRNLFFGLYSLALLKVQIFQFFWAFELFFWLPEVNVMNIFTTFKCYISVKVFYFLHTLVSLVEKFHYFASIQILFDGFDSRIKINQVLDIFLNYFPWIILSFCILLWTHTIYFELNVVNVYSMTLQKLFRL